MKPWRTGWYNSNIHTHILLTCLVPALLLVLLLIAYFTFTRLQELRTELHDTGQLIASQLAPAAEYGVITANVPVLEGLLQASLDIAHVRYVEVLDRNDRLLARAGNNTETEGRQLSFRAPIRRQKILLDDPFLPRSAPTTRSAGDDYLGWVNVSMTDNAFSQRQRQIMLSAALLVAFTLAFTLLIAHRLARNLSKPISDMSLAVQAIEKGNFATPLPVPRQRELGDLSRHINQLAAALEQASHEQRRSIEQLIQAREEAEAANRAKSDFLAMMSHELRTPMNGVLGMLQLLETTEMTSEQTEYTALANQSTEHLLRVINDILDFSRLERGALEFESIPFNLAELMQNTLQLFQHTAQQRQLRLELDAQAGLQAQEVRGDPTRIRQVLVNLLGNALKFTESGGVRLQVRWQTLNDHWLSVSCAVQDTGIGISRAQMERMFDPFQQADSSISRRYGGTGLGLSIARTLAECMGGHLRAESRPGQGSTFTLELQLGYSELASLRPIDHAEAVGHGQTVLLVEDNPVNQAVIEGMLRSLDYQVVLAIDGIQALQLVKETACVAILMDCQLPGLDGYATAAQIRLLDGHGRTPIIALTANALPGDRERCLQAGMNDYLAKPFKRAELNRILQRWLSDQARQPSEEC